MRCFTQLAAGLSVVAGVLAAPAPTTDIPNFEIGTAQLTRRQDYNQHYKTAGYVNFVPSSNGYKVEFSGAGDFVVGKGWKTGSGRTISFNGSTSTSAGTVLLSVYGWTKEPLIEYYIQEYSNTAGAAQGERVGSFTSDGSMYDIWKHQQVNQPSIVGTTTFWQYISIRKNMRLHRGTVTVQNHFDAWKKAGLEMGTIMDYQVLATEGWGNVEGKSKYTIGESKPDSTFDPVSPAPPKSPAPSAPPKPSVPPSNSHKLESD